MLKPYYYLVVLSFLLFFVTSIYADETTAITTDNDTRPQQQQQLPVSSQQEPPANNNVGTSTATPATIKPEDNNTAGSTTTSPATNKIGKLDGDNKKSIHAADVADNDMPASDITGAAGSTHKAPTPVLADKNLPKSEEKLNNKQQDKQKETVGGIKNNAATTTTTTTTAAKNNNKSSGKMKVATTTAPNQQQQQGPRVKIAGENDYCFFLPPQPNVEVAPTEDYGVAYCTSKSVVKGNEEFPEGFITKAHYSKTAKYSQVTGYMDPSKFGLLPNDDGGQYDDHGKGKPIGAKCEGYNYFVNLVEPANKRFCIRCCDSKVDCNTGRSQYGCINVVPGDYSDDELVEQVFAEIVKQEKQMKNTPETVQKQVDDLLLLSSQKTTTVKQMKKEWELFIGKLQTTYPSEQDALQGAAQTTDWFTTVPQWWYFLGRLSVTVHQDEAQ